MLSAADRALLDQLLALGQTGDHNTGDEDGYGYGENEDGEENVEDDSKDVDDASVKKVFVQNLLYIVSWKGRAPLFCNLSSIIFSRNPSNVIFRKHL